jgi:hypothetical protein
MSDKDHLLVTLNAGRDELLAAVEGLTDEQGATRPPDGGWSASECAEHLAIVETALLRRIKANSVAMEEELSRQREAELFTRTAARGTKLQAPELARPSGRYATLGDAVAGFLAARERTMRWLESCDFDLRRRAAEHPLLGQVSVYEMVLIMAGHPARHARQIVESRGQQGAA